MDALRAGALRWLAGGVVAVVLGWLLGPAVARIVESGGPRPPFAGLMAVALVIGGSAVMGLGALIRARRWSAALARKDWRPGVLRIAGPAVLQVEPLGYDEFADESAAADVHRDVAHPCHGAVARRRDPLAAVSPREWVLTADGAGTLYGACIAARR